jgi:hypothetical protein
MKQTGVFKNRLGKNQVLSTVSTDINAHIFVVR